MELILLVEAGLTSAEALRTATLNPAQVLRRENDFGTLQGSKIADMTILDANPLDDIRNVATVYRVVKGGVVYDPSRLLVEPR